MNRRKKRRTPRHEDRVGIYQIGAELGKGGFGTVYQGMNQESGDFVALKCVSLSNLGKDQLASIQMEIDLLKKLRHPNIVTYVDTQRTDRHLYIVLEFMENGSLCSIVKKFGNFAEPLAAMYISQVLQGLEYLHEQGVIHRDIKGANILTTKQGLVKLADFGVAVTESEKSNSVVGTPYWMAPEIIEMSGPSFACDVWSVGCVVIELLTGSPPYFDLAPMAALFRIVQDDYPPLPDSISPALRDFLLQCFHKEPSLRKTASELLFHPWITARKRHLHGSKQQQRVSHTHRTHRMSVLDTRTATGGRRASSIATADAQPPAPMGNTGGSGRALAATATAGGAGGGDEDSEGKDDSTTASELEIRQMQESIHNTIRLYAETGGLRAGAADGTAAASSSASSLVGAAEAKSGSGSGEVKVAASGGGGGGDDDDWDAEMGFGGDDGADEGPTPLALPDWAAPAGGAGGDGGSTAPGHSRGESSSGGGGLSKEERIRAEMRALQGGGGGAGSGGGAAGAAEEKQNEQIARGKALLADADVDDFFWDDDEDAATATGGVGGAGTTGHSTGGGSSSGGALLSLRSDAARNPPSLTLSAQLGGGGGGGALLSGGGGPSAATALSDGSLGIAAADGGRARHLSRFAETNEDEDDFDDFGDAFGDAFGDSLNSLASTGGEGGDSGAAPLSLDSSVTGGDGGSGGGSSFADVLKRRLSASMATQAGANGGSGGGGGGSGGVHEMVGLGMGLPPAGGMGGGVDDPFLFEEHDFLEDEAEAERARMAQTVHHLLRTVASCATGPAPGSSMDPASASASGVGADADADSGWQTATLAACGDLVGILRQQPAQRREVMQTQGVMGVIALLTAAKPVVLHAVLELVNVLISGDRRFQEKLSLAGAIPVILRLARPTSTPPVRLQAARFVRHLYSTSPIALQMFIACEGLAELIGFLGEPPADAAAAPRPATTASTASSFSSAVGAAEETAAAAAAAAAEAAMVGESETTDDSYELWQVSLEGVMHVFQLQTLPKNDVCRLLGNAAALPRMTRVMLRLLRSPNAHGDSNSSSNSGSNEAAAGGPDRLIQHIADILCMFAQGLPDVKAHVAQPSVLAGIMAVLSRGPAQLLPPPPQGEGGGGDGGNNDTTGGGGGGGGGDSSARPVLTAKLLRVVKNLSMEPSTLDALQAAGALPTLIPFLRHKDSHNTALLTLFYLCRINRGRQQQAAACGVVPLLQAAIATRSPLRQFALPMLCDLAHVASAATRQALWEGGSAQFYLGLLGEHFWQVFALQALAAWLAHSPPAMQANLESVLLDQRNITLIIRLFQTAQASDFEKILEPLLLLISKSTALNQTLGVSSLFMAELVERLRYPKAIVRKSLLMIMRSVYAQHRSPKQFITQHNLHPVVAELAQDGNMVLVMEIAHQLLQAFAVNDVV